MPRRITLVVLGLCLVAVAAVVISRSGSLAQLLAGTVSHEDIEGPYPEPQPILELPQRGAAAESSGWPQLFGPTHNSVSSEPGLQIDWPAAGPPIVWRRTVGTGYSSPVVWGGSLMVQHRQGNEEIVQCLQAETGEPVWEHRSPTSYRCPYEHSSGPYSTPVIDGEHVYALSAQGTLRCLSLETGQLAWSRPLNDEYRVPQAVYATGHSPLLDDDRLILNLGGSLGESGIVALDKLSGKTLWTATNHKASYATPRAATIHGRRIVFALTASGLVAIDPADGHVHWTIEFHAAQPDAVAATSPLVYGDIVLASAYQAGSLCVRVLPDGSYRELWRNRRSLVSQFNSMTCSDGYVYGWHFFDKSFRCVELTTGKLKWAHKSLVTRGNHIVVGNRMILFGEYGELACVDVNPEQPVERAVTSSLLESPCFSAPALFRGRLYWRNERELLCLSLNPLSAEASKRTQNVE